MCHLVVGPDQRHVYDTGHGRVNVLEHGVWHVDEFFASFFAIILA